MIDLVKRLREAHEDAEGVIFGLYDDLLLEAADHIEELVDALKDCREMVKFTNSYENVTAIVNRALLED